MHRGRRFAIGRTTSTGCRNPASPAAAGAAPAVLLEQVRKARLLEVADRSSAVHRHSSSGAIERTSERSKSATTDGLLRGWRGPLKSAAVQPQAVRLSGDSVPT